MASIAFVIKTELIASEFTEHFVEKFVNFGVSPNLEDEMELNFEIDRDLGKLDCYLTLAKPDDARDITKIYKDCYMGTYPYKEMEDPVEVRKMIINKDYYWVLFKSPQGKTVGCFTYVLDMEEKRGYMRGLMIKTKYQSLTNFKKLVVGSLIGMWSTFEGKIHMWYAENRTAHAKSQYMSVICGVYPVAIFPNKDIFMNKVESDVFHIIYSRKGLYKMRRKYPKLIPEAEEIYSHIKTRYNLEEAEFVEPVVQYDFDYEKSAHVKSRVKTVVKVDEFGYHDVKIKIIGTSSYISFLYTPIVQNIEKTKYQVKNDTELYMLLKELKRYAHINDVRYVECFVSAYLPNHQRIFKETGFKIRGYVPSWQRTDSEDVEQFEDNLVFNFEKGELSDKIQLVKEGQEILKIVCLSQ